MSSIAGGNRERPRSPVLSVRGATKSFAGVTALRDVDLQIDAGEVRGLVGENGAGKSTLIKIIAGALWPDRGRVTISGQELTRASPVLAGKLGVAVIHQERQIAPDISVMENVLCGRLPVRRIGTVNWSEAERRSRQRLRAIGLEIDPRVRAGTLSVAEHQQIEVARAIVGDARLIIMDEPTASLTATEVQKLFSVIRRLRENGCVVLYISHHIDEIFEIADTVTVMRDGRVVATETTTEIDHDRLALLMFGTDVSKLRSARRPPSTEAVATVPVVEISSLGYRDVLHDVDLSIAEGEIVCVTGGVGSGRRELARCIVGALRPTNGHVRIRGHLGGISPRHAARIGVGFIPDDRKREGLLTDLDVLENVDSTRLNLAPHPVALRRRRARRVSRVLESLNVTYKRLQAPVTELSGGNQQKTLLARLLNSDATILVLDEPTAGVDIRTKLEIYRLLREFAERGAAVLVFSSDYEEIRAIADRVIALKRGRVARRLNREVLTDDNLQHATT
ncbi:MAG: sugar ABC transporter ATP-binding protein [Actinomycetota bacterium]